MQLYFTGVEGFEPSTAGLGGQCYILTKPYAHKKGYSTRYLNITSGTKFLKKAPEKVSLKRFSVNAFRRDGAPPPSRPSDNSSLCFIIITNASFVK